MLGQVKKGFKALLRQLSVFRRDANEQTTIEVSWPQSVVKTVECGQSIERSVEIRNPHERLLSFQPRIGPRDRTRITTPVVNDGTVAKNASSNATLSATMEHTRKSCAQGRVRDDKYDLLETDNLLIPNFISQELQSPQRNQILFPNPISVKRNAWRYSVDAAEACDRERKKHRYSLYGDGFLHLTERPQITDPTIVAKVEELRKFRNPAVDKAVEARRRVLTQEGTLISDNDTLRKVEELRRASVPLETEDFTDEDEDDLYGRSDEPLQHQGHQGRVTHLLCQKESVNAQKTPYLSDRSCVRGIRTSSSRQSTSPSISTARNIGLLSSAELATPIGARNRSREIRGSEDESKPAFTPQGTSKCIPPRNARRVTVVSREPSNISCSASSSTARAADRPYTLDQSSTELQTQSESIRMPGSASIPMQVPARNPISIQPSGCEVSSRSSNVRTPIAMYNIDHEIGERKPVYVYPKETKEELAKRGRARIQDRWTYERLNKQREESKDREVLREDGSVWQVADVILGNAIYGEGHQIQQEQDLISRYLQFEENFALPSGPHSPKYIPQRRPPPIPQHRGPTPPVPNKNSLVPSYFSDLANPSGHSEPFPPKPQPSSPQSRYVVLVDRL